MRKLIVCLAVHILRFLNLFFKPLSLQDKVVIISRQADEPTLDIKILNECLCKYGIKTVVLTKTLEKSLPGAIIYCLQMLLQMYHLATSKIVVLDGYCILVSVLPKREKQTVIQMWHALGAIKKFGWQNTENPDGHGKEFSEAMNMHRNYDYVFSPSHITGKFFAEAFRTPEEKMALYGLPRIDFLKADSSESKRRIEARYPIVGEKINVLYAPTFRKNAALEMEQLISGFNFERFNLIIKKHFLDKGDYSWAENTGAIVDMDFSSMEWLRICEKVITDYSALAFEAAVIEREIYIYQPDADKYEHNVGLNVELEKEAIGKYVCMTEAELFETLNQPYDKETVLEFRDKYIEIDTENCTEKICEFIDSLLAE